MLFIFKVTGLDAPPLSTCLVPHAGRQVLGRPRHDGDVEDGLVAAALQLPQDEHVVVLVHQMLAGFPPPIRLS